MSMPENSERPAPGQTIVIERRERVSLFRRLFNPLLWLLLFLLLFGSFFSQEAGLPKKLGERYVAGDVTGPKVAVVEVEGLIMGETVDYALKQIRQARDDAQVKAVVLRIDSPGGTVSGSDRIWREVESLKEIKPVVASFGGMAASGGYYVAAPAHHVFAEPTTMTGSIGVIMEVPQIGELLDKVGVHFETIATGAWKDSGSMFRDMSDEERERWREVIDASYQRFVRIVAKGRGLSMEAVKTLADGKVYTADEAVQLGLVNQVGYLDDAILEARRRATPSLENSRVIRYAEPLNLTEALLSITAPKPGLKLDAETALRFQTPRILYLAR